MGNLLFFNDKVRNWNKYRGCRGSGKKKKGKLDMEEFKSICMLNINLQNIMLTRSFIFRQRNSCLKWLIRNHLGNLKYGSNFNKWIVFDLLKFKLKVFDLKVYTEIKKDKYYCVINYLDREFEFLKIKQVFKKNQEFVPELKDNIISIAYRYQKTLRSWICNYNYYGHNIDKIKEEDCLCKDVKYNKFINRDYGHIITGDLDIVEDFELRNIMKKGTKFRLRRHWKLRDIINSIKEDLDLFILKLSRRLNWPIEGFKIWKLNIIKDLKYNWNKNYMYNNKGIFQSKNIKEKIIEFKKHFIITVVDKAAGNFGILCKAFFKNLILDKYNGNGTFTKLHIGRKELEKRVLAFHKKLKLKNYLYKYPYIFPTIKFNKNPIKFRFVTCSTDCYNNVFSRKFFKYLKIIMYKVLEKGDSFIINNNMDVLDFMENRTFERSSLMILRIFLLVFRMETFF